MRLKHAMQTQMHSSLHIGKTHDQHLEASRVWFMDACSSLRQFRTPFCWPGGESVCRPSFGCETSIETHLCMWFIGPIGWSPRLKMQEECAMLTCQLCSSHLVLLAKIEKRPDCRTLVPIVWDFTCLDTLTPSHLSKTMFQARAAASMAEPRKYLKYEDISHTHIFIPVAVETKEAWGSEAMDLIEALGRRLFEATQDQRSTFFLRLRVYIVIQRGNALSVLGTFPSGNTDSGLWVGT